MNLPPSHSRQRPSNASPSPVTIPNDLIVELLSLLPVKSVMRMRCVSKFCNSLYTDPIFVKLHLHRSPQDPHLALITNSPSETARLVPFPVNNLLENSPITLTDDPSYVINNYFYPLELIHQVIGSCYGLICILSYSDINPFFWLSFWNPSTRAMSKQLRFSFGLFIDKFIDPTFFKFSFGYDNSTNSYKIVMLTFHSEKLKIVEARVFSLRDNVWREIQNFPAVPFQLIRFRHQVNEGVYLNGTLNWLAIFYFKVTCGEVIISLDLKTETYRQIQVPSGLEEIHYVYSTIGVLMNCLSFSHHLHQTHFVIWRMMDFGVEESWTQFLKISYESLNIDHYLRDHIFDLIPLYLSENGDSLILANSLEGQAILYNIRDNTAERTRITNKISWFSVKNYVKSLASIF
ncbi:F-box/kelch-repeat protein At3g06240-like [Vicia villosa]|uniref:F-box/kelch-repeat protein At3g06240-like n=1 Tax=Vicia villosa TaxID=3911 RepID=UPI00273AD3FF|nr:F-box/kelch-repeat protein At3g06240-like [Vicia villosa]XP_058738960.1 F-box/kelch-repeat protein At3g06240-like [Vicia villosa]XP_058738961.1 F-box/kelch-repeat protein At3g06240-like [Vicia villosa]XP_058738962.1 F-box/kelch-repeat protein At3g06240-like [Vicia villosa]XP_058738963.1 F-box/kelch-repeat protein At3g06240-like [Vicia villosa]XP_058738964.1 F-box/kelch-repeat protein At3g06240-like [Vicia villosa]XP_058738965.1 F-box/kelch-repeat protein At3g06240-like [Vicia villosa]XP_0